MPMPKPKFEVVKVSWPSGVFTTVVSSSPGGMGQ